MKKATKQNIIIYGVILLIIPLLIGTISLNSIKNDEKVKQNNFDNNMKTALDYIEKGNYLKAYRKLISISTYNEEQEQTIIQKKKMIEEKALNQLSDVVKSLIEKKEYDKALQEIGQYSVLKDSEIDKLEKQIKDELEQQKIQKEEEEKAKEEAEEKAKKEAEEKSKKEAEEKAKKEAEEKAKEEAEEKVRKKQEGVRIGMTKQDVLDSSWGKPYDINTSTGSWGVHEQWCYEGYNYLYFKNGILTSIQN